MRVPQGSREATTHILAVVLVLTAVAAPAVASEDEDVVVHIFRGYLGVTLAGGAGHVVGSFEDGDRAWIFEDPPRVTHVSEGGPSDGVLRQGDIILAVDGVDIETEEASRHLQYPAAGEQLDLTIERSGRRREVTLVAGTGEPPEDHRNTVEIIHARPDGEYEVVTQTMKDGDAVTAVSQSVSGSGRAQVSSWYGLGLESSTIMIKKKDDDNAYVYFDDPPRIYSVDPDSPADRAGLQRGDTIIKIDGYDLDRDEGGERWSIVQPGEPVMLTYSRDGDFHTVQVVPEEHPSRHVHIDVSPYVVYSTREDEDVHLRYAGSVGDVDVEVRGAGSVTVTKDDGRLIISIGDVEVKLSESDRDD